MLKSHHHNYLHSLGSCPIYQRAFSTHTHTSQEVWPDLDIPLSPLSLVLSHSHTCCSLRSLSHSGIFLTCKNNMWFEYEYSWTCDILNCQTMIIWNRLTVVHRHTSEEGWRVSRPFSELRMWVNEWECGEKHSLSGDHALLYSYISLNTSEIHDAAYISALVDTTTSWNLETTYCFSTIPTQVIWTRNRRCGGRTEAPTHSGRSCFSSPSFGQEDVRKRRRREGGEVVEVALFGINCTMKSLFSWPTLPSAREWCVCVCVWGGWIQTKEAEAENKAHAADSRFRLHFSSQSQKHSIHVTVTIAHLPFVS